MLIPPRVTCSHTWPPSWWRETNFIPTRDMFYSQGSQGLLSSCGGAGFGLYNGSSSRSGFQKQLGTDRVVIDCSMIQWLLSFCSIHISVFHCLAKYQPDFVLTLAPRSTRRAEVWSDCVIAKMEEKILWLWESLCDCVPGNTSLPKLCCNPTLHRVQPLLYLKVQKWNRWNETPAGRRAQIICISGQGDYRKCYLSGLL